MLKNICAIFMVAFAINFSVTFASMPLEPLDEKSLSAEERMIDAAIFDNSRTLAKSEIQTLTNKIKSVEQKHNIKIGVEFLKTIGGRNVETAAHELLNQHYGGAKNGGIIFLVVMDSRQWYVATDSTINNFVNASDIGNYLLPNLRDGDYFGACENYIDAVDKSLSYYEQNGAVYDSSDEFNIMAAMAAILLGILFGISVRSWLIGTMSNVHHEVTAKDYLKRETVKFIKNRDTYLFTNVERRPKPSSNSHQGMSGGGHGGSSGGGAGGSF